MLSDLLDLLVTLVVVLVLAICVGIGLADCRWKRK